MQLRVQRATSEEQRLQLAFDVSLFARELAREGFGANIGSSRNRVSCANCCGWHLSRHPFLPRSDERSAGLQRITAALDQAGIAYVLNGSINCSSVRNLPSDEY